VTVPFSAAALLIVLLATPAAGLDIQDYYNKKCKVCHTLNGVSGPKAKVGGSLDGVGAKHDKAWFKALLTDPTSVLPDTKKKKTKMTPEELDAMAQFMSEQK
jgi:mono/diheme cytochrome c family protein